jgi:hypothetical protein
MWSRKLLLFVTCALFGFSASSAGAQSPIEQTLSECAHFSGHRFEVCGAYMWNDAHWSLQPYYKYVHSDSFFAFLKNRLSLKYRNDALQAIRRRARNWPSGTNTVEGPRIDILRARSSLKCNQGVLITRESWKVVSRRGSVLYQERRQIHTVILRRVPDERFRLGSHVLHAWVVYKIYDSRRDIQPTC